jgi:hypothetical protein
MPTFVISLQLKQYLFQVDYKTVFLLLKSGHLIEDGHDDALTAGGADSVVVRLNVDQQLKAIQETVLGKWFHCPGVKDFIQKIFL